MGSFPKMVYLANYAKSTTYSLSCTNCAALSSFGSFPLLQVVAYSYTVASLTLSCNNCGVTTLGNFSALTSVGYMSPASLVISCTTCNNLSKLGLFGSLQNVLNSYGPSGSAVLLSLSCTTCPVLTTLASMPVLNAVNNPSATYANPSSALLQVQCNGCNQLTTLSNMPQLHNIEQPGGTAANNASLSLSCLNSANVVSLANVPQLTMTFGGSLSLSGSNCPSLLGVSYANFTGTTTNTLCNGAFTACTSSSCSINPISCLACSVITDPLYCALTSK
jgi:ribosomal protein S27E